MLTTRRFTVDDIQRTNRDETSLPPCPALLCSAVLALILRVTNYVAAVISVCRPPGAVYSVK